MLRTAILPVLLTAQAAAADPIALSCAAVAPAEICTCATERLANSPSQVDLAFYAVAADRAAWLQAGGISLAEAWDQATEQAAAAAGLSQSDAITRLNAAGSAHRDAIEACQS